MKMRILLRVMRRTSYGLGNAGNIAWDKIAKGWLRRLRICDPAVLLEQYFLVVLSAVYWASELAPAASET